MAAKGCDYSWDRPDLACLKSKGVTFIVRYGSRDPSKNLSKAELDAAASLGLGVAVVWQEGKTQMTRGHDGGVADARDADAFVKGLGLAGIPVYFSCDYDPPSGDWPKIDAYLDGVASVIGRQRTGGYGGLPFIQRGFGNGKLTWGWQTYAWSGGAWDARAQLRQVDNDVIVCGGAIDWDEAHAADFGQWPRPGQPAQEEDMAVVIPPGPDARTVGVSFNGAPYKSVGFCADSGAFPETITVRCAFHRQDGSGWWVQNAYLDKGHPKVVITIPGKADGASFVRLDAMNCDVIPDFGT